MDAGDSLPDAESRQFPVLSPGNRDFRSQDSGEAAAQDSAHRQLSTHTSRLFCSIRGSVETQLNHAKALAIKRAPPQHDIRVFYSCVGHVLGIDVATFNAIDEANREALAVEAGISIPASRVVRVLDQLVEMYGAPAMRCDNGPEFISGTFSNWCEERKIEVRYNQPGKPDQNAFIERLNRTYRGDVLDAWVFGSIAEVQDLSDQWLANYNENRPHDSLGGLSPTEFLPRPRKSEVSSLEVCA